MGTELQRSEFTQFNSAHEVRTLDSSNKFWSLFLFTGNFKMFTPGLSPSISTCVNYGPSAGLWSLKLTIVNFVKKSCHAVNDPKYCIYQIAFYLSLSLQVLPPPALDIHAGCLFQKQVSILLSEECSSLHSQKSHINRPLRGTHA